MIVIGHALTGATMLVAVDEQTGALGGRRELVASDADSLDALRVRGGPRGRGAGVGDRGTVGLPPRAFRLHGSLPVRGCSACRRR
jgi:hypothetical protein